MAAESLARVYPIEAVYVVVFAFAALACFVGVRFTGRIDDPETRRGLVFLLLTSGGWATAHVGFLLAPSESIGSAFHIAGLVVGLATVGPWLYFCSAFTGRSMHRVPSYRRVLLGVFLAIVAVKLTNPIHGLYFTAGIESTPFPRVAVQNSTLHWVVAGLAYSLVTVGYFMLFELFAQVGYDTRALTSLVVVTAIPILLNVVGDTTPYLLDIAYEPLGVAAFAIGVLSVFSERLQIVRTTGDLDDPLIVIDADGEIRHLNALAQERLPGLADAAGEPIETVFPGLAAALDGTDRVLEVPDSEETQYFLVSMSPLGASGAGRIVVLTDVTESERYRRRLEAQNERLERFASVISHDLRNPLTVAKGRLDIARGRYDDENLEEVAVSLERMEEIIEDVLALARQGRDIDEIERVSLAELVETCLETIDTGEATFEVDDDFLFRADPERVRQLLENLFRNALDHAGPDARVKIGSLEDDAGFFVEDDGPGVPVEDRETVFEESYTTAAEGTGLGLAIVREIADAHGWEVSVTESEAGGARFEVTGVELVE